MLAAPELLHLVPIDVVVPHATQPLLDERHDEIARLERELAEIELALADAERRVTPRPDDRSDDAALGSVVRLLDDALASARTEIRIEIEEPANRVAADRLLTARREANRILGAARADLGAALLARSTPDGTELRRSASDLLAAADAVATTEADEGVALLPIDDVTPAPPPAVDPPAPNVEPAPVEAGKGGDAFDAFWSEHDVAVETRDRTIAPLEALGPMAVLLVLLLLLLHLI